MAVTPTVFTRAVAPIIYTVPTGTAIVTNMIVANSGTTAGYFTLLISGITVMGSGTIAANSTAFFDMKQVVSSGTVISGYGSAGLSFHISGILYS